MKRIGLEPAWKLRGTSYIRAMLQSPPTGYRFEVLDRAEQNIWSAISVMPFAFNVQEMLGEFIPLVLLKSYFDGMKNSSKGMALTYALDHLVFRKEPWILELTFELPSTLCGGEVHLKRYAGIVGNRLKSEDCRSIVSQTKIGIDALAQAYGEDIRQKASFIPPAGIAHYVEREESDGIRLLFVNSSNINTMRSFYVKGGAEVVESFLLLRKSYDRVSLIMRSPVPNFYKRRLKGIKGVYLQETPLPENKMAEVWKNADIFVHPHHTTMPYSVIDAMGWGLPVISSDTWCMPEIIENGVDGLLVHDALASQNTTGPTLHLTREYRARLTRGAQVEMVRDIVESIFKLIDRRKLASSFGSLGRAKVADGPFSLRRRNESLKKVLERSVKD